MLTREQAAQIKLLATEFGQQSYLTGYNAGYKTARHQKLDEPTWHKSAKELQELIDSLTEK